MFYSDHSYAGFWVRYCANMLDSLYIGILFSILTALAYIFGGQLGISAIDKSSIDYSFLAFLVCYEVLLPATKMQGTLGKHFLCICIVDKHGTQIGFFRSLARFILLILIYYVCFILTICYLTVSFVGFLPLEVTAAANFNPQMITALQTTNLYYVSIAGAFIFCFSLLSIVINKKKRGLHDMLAGTMVIYKYDL